MRTELVTTLKRKASELLADIEKDGLPSLSRSTACQLPTSSMSRRTMLYSSALLARGDRAGEKAVETVAS